jgi:hypothetical protein
MLLLLKLCTVGTNIRPQRLDQNAAELLLRRANRRCLNCAFKIKVPRSMSYASTYSENASCRDLLCVESTSATESYIMIIIIKFDFLPGWLQPLFFQRLVRSKSLHTAIANAMQQSKRPETKSTEFMHWQCYVTHDFRWARFGS